MPTHGCTTFSPPYPSLGPTPYPTPYPKWPENGGRTLGHPTPQASLGTIYNPVLTPSRSVNGISPPSRADRKKIKKLSRFRAAALGYVSASSKGAVKAPQSRLE